MKYIISERQYNLIKEEDQEILEIPSLDHFDNDWNLLQEFLKKRGNPPYGIASDLDLTDFNVVSMEKLQYIDGDFIASYDTESLGDLETVGGYLDLSNNPILSLDNLMRVGGDLYLNNSSIISLGDLRYVGGELNLNNTPIESLGKLAIVKGNIFLQNTPLGEMLSQNRIDLSVKVRGRIIYP